MFGGIKRVLLNKFYLLSIGSILNLWLTLAAKERRTRQQNVFIRTIS